MTYKHTKAACYLGYITQAVVNNFLPLLFLTFERSYDISAARISVLIAVNFVTQLTIDLISAPIIDRIGYRASMLLGCLSSALGLELLAVLPDVMPPLVGLYTCVFLCAIGGGIMEVLVSPIIEGCPADNKAGQMALLHSFYCWGSAGCVMLSTMFFAAFGTAKWRILAVMWTVIPLACLALFTKVPITPPVESAAGMKLGELLRRRVFWLFVVMMVCAGASELAVAQWASAFAEDALGVSKSVGDLAGPFSFAILMGTARALCGRITEKSLPTFMVGSSFLCLIGYALITLSPMPMVSLIGCGICGFSVGVMWPGTFSLAAARLPKGGTLMFALFALAGDLGCTSGPVTVGLSDSFRRGFMLASLFPLMMLICSLVCMTHRRKG